MSIQPTYSKEVNALPLPSNRPYQSFINQNSESNRLESATKLKTANFKKHFQSIGLKHLRGSSYSLQGHINFPFRAYKYPTGHYIWMGTRAVTGVDVLSIVKIAAQYKQAVHINTGTHGNKQGYTSYTQPFLAEKKFTKEDFSTAIKYANVSIHIVSQYSKAIYPHEANHIINAWCFSIKSENMIPPESYFQDKKLTTYVASPYMLEKILSDIENKEVKFYQNLHRGPLNNLDIETQILSPLEILLEYLALRLKINSDNPDKLVKELKKKGAFTPKSNELVEWSLKALRSLCRMKAHNKPKTDSLTQKQRDEIECAYFLVLKPLAYTFVRKEKPPIDLLQKAVEEIWWLEDSAAVQNHIPMISPLIKAAGPSNSQFHLAAYKKLSTKSLLNPLREHYYKTLSLVDPNNAKSLLSIPNRQGERLAKTVEKEKLNLSLYATTTAKNPPPPYLAITGIAPNQTLYLDPTLFPKIIDAKSNIIREYKNSLHPVCRLQTEKADLHLKQKPGHPMMEYAVYSLISRLVGVGAPPSTLLRFEIHTQAKTKAYPVLASTTVEGTNLKTILKNNPNYVPKNARQFTLMAITALLTRPGDGRSSNFVVDKNGDLISVDNDVSFVEPLVETKLYQTINFCSILYCFKNAPLSKTALTAFAETDPDLIFTDWLEELSKREAMYRALFSQSERKQLFNEDHENQFTPELLLRSGTITTLYTQYHFLKSALKKILPKTAADLLKYLITLRRKNLTAEILGKRLHQHYSRGMRFQPEEHLKKATSRSQNVSMTTKQHFIASLGKPPTSKEIEKRELFSLEKTCREFQAYSLFKNQKEVTLKNQEGKEALEIDFSSITREKRADVERQTLMLNSLPILFETKRPEAITLRNCAALKTDRLLPLLHKNLTYLDIRGSGLDRIPNEIETRAPNLEELYLSDCKNLKYVQKNYTFSSEELNLPKLKILHMARCPSVVSVKLNSPLEELKANKNPKFSTLEFPFVLGRVNVKECSRLQVKETFVVFGKYKWEEHFGEVGAAPSLPKEIRQVLESPCPFWPGKKVKETHMLTLIPQTVNGKKLTLNSLSELIQNPKAGHKTKYSDYNGIVKKELGSQGVQKSHWALMTQDVIPESRNKSYKEQKRLLHSYAQKSHTSYALPTALEAAVSILMEYVANGKRLYSDDPYTYTRCLEKVHNNQWPAAIGGFAAGGLAVSYDLWDFDSSGVGALRKF